MKSIKKMDERELMLSLKVCRVCYVVLSLTIALCFFLAALDILKGKESIYLSIIMFVDAITYLIATLIYNPDKKIKNEK